MLAILAVLSMLLVAACGGGDASPPTSTPTSPSAFAASVEATLARAPLGEPRFPSVVVAVSQGDVVRVHVARGLSPSGEPVVREARSRIGSVTKAFIALAVLKRVDEGAWSLDASLAELLPEVSGLAGVTVRHALAHTSGIADVVDDALLAEIRANPARRWTDAELAARGLSRPRLSPPGQAFAYSNTNYHLLGMALERAERRALTAVLERRVTAPLALLDTRYPSGADLPAPRLEGSLEGASTTALDPSYAGAAGAMDSTALDLLRFGRALVRGTLVNDRSLRPTEHRFVDASSLGLQGLAYGFGVMRIDGWYGHVGDVLGYGSAVLHHPERDLTVVVLATGDFGNAVALCRALTRALPSST